MICAGVLYFRGLEIVADRATRRPFDPSMKINARIKAEGMTRGLMCYPGGGTIDGVTGDHILLAPPFILSDSEVGMIVERLGDAVDAVIASAVG